MAFLSRAGSILKQSVSKQIGVVWQISASNPSIYQALRCMSSKLFVGGLPYSVDENGLRDTFSQYGQVIEAKVIIDREQNRSKGFGFITFSSSEEASSALQALDGQDIQGRRVRVNYATERAPRSFGGGGGYGGGGYGGGQQSGGYGGQYGGGNSGGYGGQYGGGNSGGYGGQYGGGNSGGYGGGYDAGNSGGGYDAGNSGGGYPSGGAAQGVATGAGDSYFGGGAAGDNVTADTGFGSSGFEDGAGLGNGVNDQFGDGSTGGDFEPTGPSEGNVGDDEPDDFVKQA